MSIAISWLHKPEGQPEKYFTCDYDDSPRIIRYGDKVYALVDFNPITDERNSVPMREPLTGINTTMLMVNFTSEAFTPVCEIPEPTDTLSIDEIMSTILEADGSKNLQSLVTDKEIRAQLECKHPFSRSHFMQPERSDTHYYATKIDDRSRANQSGLLIMEVPANLQELDPKKIDMAHAQMNINARKATAKSEPLELKSDLYGTPGAKIELMKFHCAQKHIPFRLELRNVPSDGIQTLRNRKEAGFVNEHGVYQISRQKDKAQGLNSLFSNIARLMEGAEKTSQSFPHGDIASRQMREKVTPRKVHNTPSPSQP